MSIKDLIADIVSVGVDEMDTQHKDYGRLVGKIKQIEDGQGGELTRMDVLDELMKFNEYHFKCEENLMREYNYPDYAEHEAEHAELTSALHRSLRTACRDDFNLHEFYTFISDWVLDHTREMDVKLGRYIEKKRSS